MSMTILEELSFLMQMKEDNEYLDIKPLKDRPGYYACIAPFLFTHGIILGQMGDTAGYTDRWCYHSYQEAKTALEQWDGKGEPDGWHRNLNTGRRRPDGRSDMEYVEW